MSIRSNPAHSCAQHVGHAPCILAGGQASRQAGAFVGADKYACGHSTVTVHIIYDSAAMQTVSGCGRHFGGASHHADVAGVMRS